MKIPHPPAGIESCTRRSFRRADCFVKTNKAWVYEIKGATSRWMGRLSVPAHRPGGFCGVFTGDAVLLVVIQRVVRPSNTSSQLIRPSDSTPRKKSPNIRKKNEIPCSRRKIERGLQSSCMCECTRVLGRETFHPQSSLVPGGMSVAGWRARCILIRPAPHQRHRGFVIGFLPEPSSLEPLPGRSSRWTANTSHHHPQARSILGDFRVEHPCWLNPTPH